MKYRWSILLSIVLACAVKPALAESLAVGQHVHVGSINEDGTVVQLGSGPSANLIKVHLNKLGDAFPSVGAWFDTKLSQVTAGGGAGGGGGQTQGQQQQQQLGQQPGQNANSTNATQRNTMRSVQATQPQATPPQTIDNNAAPNAALFKQLIIKHYQIQADTGQTKSVSFKTFSVGAATQYEAVYKGDTMLGAHGHKYQAWPVHTTYTVLTHNADPQAPDTEQDYGIDWMCYKDNGVEWIASQVGQFQQPGWPREIQKR
jgi:hypothetical protein